MRISFRIKGMLSCATLLTLMACAGGTLQAVAGQGGSQELQLLSTDQDTLTLPNTYGIVGNEDLNEAGDYIFTTGSGGAIFLRKAGTPIAVRLLQYGEPVPGYPGSRANSFATPKINAAGIIVFYVDFSMNGLQRGAILRYDGSDFTTVAYSHDVAPGTSGTAYGRSLALLGINTAGDVAFVALLVPAGPPSLQPAAAIFIDPAGGATVRITGEGDPAPGTSGGIFDFIAGMVFNDAAEVLFRAQVVGGMGGYGEFAASATAVRKVVSNGDAKPEGGTFSLTTSAGVSWPYFNNTGMAMFQNGNTLYVSSPAMGLSVAVNLSTAVPSPPGGTMTTIYAPFGFTDAGVTVFRAALSGSSASAGIFRYTPGNPLQTVAYVGQEAPGTTQTFGSNWPNASMNGSGTFSFVNMLSGTGVQAGIFQQSGSASPVAVVLQSASSTLPGGGILRVNSSVTRTMNNSTVYFRADVAGGTADFGTFLASGATITPLMSTEDPLPNGALTWLSTYRVGAAGPFVGFVAGKAGGRFGYWVKHIPTGTTHHVVSELDPAPEGNAHLRLVNLSTVYVNTMGAVAFLARYIGGNYVSGNNLMMWDIDGGIQRLVAEGAPEDGSGLPFSNITLPALGPSPLNSNFEVVFHAILNWGSGPTGIFVARPGSPTQRIAWTGESAPTGGTFNNLPAGAYVINDAGKVAFRAGTSLGVTGIFVAEAWQPAVKIVATGDAGPNGGTFNSFVQQPSGINNSGEVVFLGQLTGGPGGGFYVGMESAPPVAVAEYGSAAPAGGTYAFAGTPPDIQINHQGDVLFRASLTGGSADSGLFLRRGRTGPVQAVVLQGQSAPATAGTFATISSSGTAGEYYALGPTGEIVFNNYINLSGTYVFGMFRYPRNNTLEKLMLCGDTAPDGGGATMESITTFVGVGDPWRFSFWAGLTGGSFGTAIYTTKAPADITDFNGDGHTDIVWRNNSTGQNALWLMSETELSSIADLPTLANTDYQIGGTADFDRDGNQDIVWRNPITGANAIWLMNGTSLASIVDLPALPNPDYRICAVGNITDEEEYFSYVVWRNYATGQNAFWVLLGTSLVAIADMPTLPNADYKIAGVGDFDYDGFPDILWRNQVTGQNAVWVLDDGPGDSLVVSTIIDLPALPNTNYWISAIGDFNRDGNLDIGWRNYQTGQNALWLMQGATLTGIADLPALPNSDYAMAGPR